MACFLVPAAEAVVMTIVTKAVASKEKETEAVTIEGAVETESVRRFPLSQKIRWLTNLLWGGVILLLFEHVWHGEVVPWFPFLTAAADPADAAEMLHEMSTVGVTMAILVTAVWGVMLLCAHILEKRSAKAAVPAAE